MLDKLVLIKKGKEWLFSLKNLSQEEKDYIHRIWSKGQ